MTALLEIRDLHASVGDKPILKGINLTINAGEVHAIMGPNGSGKSTMSYVLAGRDGYEVTGGDILMNGNPCWRWSPTSVPGPVCSWHSSIRWNCPVSAA